MNAPCGVVLAAGAGRRFGSNKLLQRLDDGTPLLLHSVRVVTAALARTVVVVDPDDDRVMELLSDAGVEVVPNPAAGRGMGTSLACGVNATAGSDGWVIALADMPWIRADTIRTVAATLDGPNAICAPSYRGQRGHPVAFGRGYGRALTALDGDAGARHVITANREYLTLIATDDPGVVADVDHPRDLNK